MAVSAQSRNRTLTTSLSRVPLFDLHDLARLGTELPECLPDVAACARRFYPRSGLGRAA